ncbi:hypothetical protein KL911_004690 [Ogataea haglerorum]|uniref:uncharacterized protein n=1 Tax=Ogataea haglerorum TaxID=1937702 RepID=UPI001C89F7C4|nr:uncharacterized protein KL911_004690 [Ogataea haglerorum]KAG7750811.1 hypothetical protein KL911_004690 [Ogataea haglerorum]
MELGAFVETDGAHESTSPAPTNKASPSFEPPHSARSHASSVSSVSTPLPKRRISVDIPRLPDDNAYEVISNTSSLRTSAMAIPERPRPSGASNLSTSTTSSTASIPLRIKKSTPANPETTRTDAVSLSFNQGDGLADTDGSMNGDGDQGSQESAAEQPTVPAPPQNATFMSSIKSLASMSRQQEVDTTADTVSTLGTPMRSRSEDDTKGDVEDEGKLEHVVNGHTEMLSYRRSSRRAKSSSISSLPKTPLTEASNDSFERSPAEFSSKLYTDEKYLDTQYRYASLTRNVEFHELFKNIPDSERLLDDFSCALSREILLQGRLYVSEHYLCFNSNLLGWVTSLVISHDEVVHFERKSTAGLFPNGIVIETRDGKHTFASFISRDSTLNFLETVWSKSVALSKAKNEQSRALEQIESNLAAPAIQQLSEDDVFTIDENGPLMDGETEEEVTAAPVYRNEGPDNHSATECSYEPEAHGESIILDKVFAAPMGVVFNVLFGEKITFHKHVMELSDGYNFSDYGAFKENENEELVRKFEYEKKLNNSIGPKSAKVETTELIQHKDFNGYVEVVSTACTPNVPSGTAFHVVTRYIFTWAENSHTRLKISYKIVWTGSSWIKGVIEKSTKSGQQKTADLIGEELDKILPEIQTGRPTESEETEQKEDISTEPAPKQPAGFVLLLEQLAGNWLAVLVTFILLLQLYFLYRMKCLSEKVAESIELNVQLLRRIAEP